MTDQKAENLLNLSLSTPETERVKSENLNVGYNPVSRTWELIVKYNGDLSGALQERFPSDNLENQVQGAVQITPLLGGFAILTVPEPLVEDVINLPEIEYAEQPKRLYFAVNQAKAASCLFPIQTGEEGLSGEGVLVAVIDSGIDYFHEDFRNPDGTTRILYLYDQSVNRVLTKEQIDEILLGAGEGMADGELFRSANPDPSGHGTAVAGIAAGNGRGGSGQYRGVAYESDLLVVRLGTAQPGGFPRTTQVMAGVDFAVRKAMESGRPMAVNLSFGNNYGSHDGNGLLERYLDTVAEMSRSVFVVGMGNEGDAGGHAEGILGDREEIIELSVSPYEGSFGVQLWKSYLDDFDLFLQGPSRSVTEQISQRSGAYSIPIDGTDVLVYYGEPGPFNQSQEIYFDFVPGGDFVESGIWRFLLRPREIVDGRYDFWLPASGTLNRSTRFLRSSPETTLTIPATAARPVSVAAYDDSTMVYAPFSGRGSGEFSGIQKPDLAAPGVGIVTSMAGGGYGPVTGTSFAAPFVTGTAALLMEWGIVRGNDPYLYGDKVKAYLQKGARPLPGERERPNPRTGYGALCASESFPGGRL